MSITIKCPVCGGAGTVARPPHVPGDVNYWCTDTTQAYICPTCNGSRIIERSKDEHLKQINTMYRWEIDKIDVVANSFDNAIKKVAEINPDIPKKLSDYHIYIGIGIGEDNIIILKPKKKAEKDDKIETTV